MQIQQKNKHTTAIVVCSVVVLIGAATGYFAYAYKNKTLWPFNNQLSSKTQSNSGSINYSPPTKQEVQSSQDGKKAGAGSNTSTTPAKTINIVVSYAGPSNDRSSLEVNAYTPDVIEGDGTCTATFTKDALTVTAQSQASVDATSSICRPILIPYSKFSSTGSWSLSVTYKSASYSGVSSSQSVEVNP